MGFTTKQYDPSNDAVSNDEHISNTLFLETQPLSFEEKTSRHHFPNIDMYEFDRSHPSGWVIQMEHYFSLHGIKDV